MSKAVHLNILEAFRLHYEDEINFHQKDQKVIFH